MKAAALRPRTALVFVAAATALSLAAVTQAQAAPIRAQSVRYRQVAGTTAASQPSNLLGGVEGSFDGSIGTWSCGGTCQLADVASPVLAGSGALAIMQTGDGTLEWVASAAGPSGAVPAVAGAIYTGGASTRAAAIGRTLAPFLVFYNAHGEKIDGVFGQAITDSTSWTPASVTAVAPAGSTRVLLGFVYGRAEKGEIHFLDEASLYGRPGGSRAIAGPLHTVGNRIVDAHGQAVVLRGLVRAGSEVNSPSFPSDAEIAQAKAWGANFVRVPLGEQLWLNTCTASNPTNDAGYVSQVDNEVSSITRRGMVALLDLHFNVITTCGQAAQHTMADARYAVTFWRQVAHRYARNSLVAFDLYNEPHDISDRVWREGGSAQEGSITYVAAGMQQLYNAVRNQGAHNLVFVSGTDWALQPSTMPVSGYNIVNAAHVYTCSDTTLSACTASNPYDPSPYLASWLATGRTSPVMVTEFGWPSSESGTYNRNVISYATAHGWGWSAFAWDGSTVGAFDLLVSDGSTYEPAPAGQPVLAGFGAN